MKSNAKRLALLAGAVLVLVVTGLYAMREPAPQWSAFVAGIACAGLVCTTFRVGEEDW